jgi:K+/H+ antiporter YhaU regulatory subunit KhtT
VGQTIGTLDVRATTGVTIIAIQRKNQQIRNPGPESKLQIGDEVSFVGSRSERIAANKFFVSTATTKD